MIAGGGIDLVGQNGVARIDEDLDTVAINDHSEVHMTAGSIGASDCVYGAKGADMLSLGPRST
jgi:hypothetical protein